MLLYLYCSSSTTFQLPQSILYSYTLQCLVSYIKKKLLKVNPLLLEWQYLKRHTIIDVISHVERLYMNSIVFHIL